MHRPQPSSLRLNIPEGAAGTRETLKHMRQLVQQGKNDQRLRDLANSIVKNVPAKDWDGELTALFEYVRSNVRYSLDPNDIETIQGAAQTLQLGYGDCDDFSVLLATLAECLGHPACLVALGFQDKNSFGHVMVFASGAGETPWRGMDATEAHPFGWFPKGALCEMVAPISETAGSVLAGGDLPYDDGYTDWAGGKGGGGFGGNFGGDFGTRWGGDAGGGFNAGSGLDSGSFGSAQGTNALPGGGGGDNLGDSGGMNSGGTESITVSAYTTGGYSYDGPSYSVQTNGWTPGYPSYTPNDFAPSFSTSYFQNQLDSYGPPQTASALPIEEVTVQGFQPDPVSVQTPNIPSYSPQWYFDQLAAYQQSEADYWNNYFNSPEEVTVEGFRPPDPVQVQAPYIPDYAGPVQTDYLLPDFASLMPPEKKNKPPAGQPAAKGAPSGGGSGGGSQPQQKPQQQVQNFNFPKQPAQQDLSALLKSIFGQQAAGAVTPQQRAQLDALSAAQLAALLKSGQLTPQQQLAAQQALAKKLQQPIAAGGAGMTPAAAQRAAASAASPFQGKAAVLPAIIIGGVLAAYGITHRKQIAYSYAGVKRRVRRTFA